MIRQLWDCLIIIIEIPIPVKMICLLKWSPGAGLTLTFIPLTLTLQAIRVLGLLGALDPYKHKVFLGQIDNQSNTAQVLSQSEDKGFQDPGQQAGKSGIQFSFVQKDILSTNGKQNKKYNYRIIQYMIMNISMLVQHIKQEFIVLDVKWLKVETELQYEMVKLCPVTSHQPGH